MAPGDVTRLAQEFDSKQQPVVTVPDTPTRFPPIGRPSSSTSSASHRRPSVAGGEGTGDEPPVPDEGSEGEEGIASAWVNAGRGRGAGRGKQRSIRGKAHF